MIAASIAWELAGNTGGRFRLGLGSQVKAHIERRYGVAVRSARAPDARLRAGGEGHAGGVPRRAEARRTTGPTTSCRCCPDQWRPPMHEHGDIKVDVSAVGPWMTTMAGEVADGVHVHPLHSVQYLEQRLDPGRPGRSGEGRPIEPRDIDLLIPVFIVPGDTPEEREPLARRARTQIGVLRLDAELRVPVRRPRVRGDVREAQRAAEGRRPRRPRGNDHRRDARPVRRRRAVGRHRRPDHHRYRGRAERVISYLTIDDITREPRAPRPLGRDRASRAQRVKGVRSGPRGCPRLLTPGARRNVR